jgi:transposase
VGDTDKGYDYDHLRPWLRSRRVMPRTVRKGVGSSARLGRHRWTVERTVSRPGGIRRLHCRYEHKAERFLAIAGIAATLICYGRLTRGSTAR